MHLVSRYGSILNAGSQWLNLPGKEWAIMTLKTMNLMLRCELLSMPSTNNHFMNSFLFFNRNKQKKKKKEFLLDGNVALVKDESRYCRHDHGVDDENHHVEQGIVPYLIYEYFTRLKVAE